MLDCIDQLDVASYALTRVEGFSKREAPSAAEIERWLGKRDPLWRTGSSDCARLEQIASQGGGNGSFALQALRDTSTELLSHTASGWKLIAIPGATSILRWRLPLGTIHAAAAASAPKLDSPGGQPRLAAYDEFLAQLQDLGAADGHVHVGTCLPFEALFELLIDHIARVSGKEAAAPGGGSPPLFSDSADEPFDPSTLLVFATALSVVLRGFLAAEEVDFDAFIGSSGINDKFGQALLRGSGWEFVQNGDPHSLVPGRRIESPAALLASIAWERSELGDPYQTAIQRKFDLLRKQFREPPGAAYARCVEDLLRCEALLYVALAQGNRAGLAEFLVTSKRLKLLRKSVPDRTRAVIKHGLPHLARGMRLKGIELRTAEQNEDHKDVADLAKSLDAQLAGYEEAMEAMDSARRPMATWPICLIKDPAIVSDPEKPAGVAGAEPRFELANLFSLIDITAELLTRFPTARKLISGLDVAGDENAVPSWCFALLFREFMERLSDTPAPEGAGRVAFRVHAGEEFHSPLQGLRRIDEAVRFVVPDEHLARIGHGLALSHSPTHVSAEALGRQPLDEAFDDLVWAWMRLRDGDAGGAGDLTRVLEAAIMSKGADLYGECGAGAADDYASAYEMRFKTDALRSVGFLSPSSYQARLKPSNTMKDPIDSSPAKRILFKYLTQSKLRAACNLPLLDPVWLTQAIDTVRPIVRGKVSASGGVIEVCPTSNVLIGGLDGYQRHPVHDWIEAGIDVTVNTDDPGLFSVNLVDEYGYLWSSASGTPKQKLDKFKVIQELSCKMVNSCHDAAETAAAVAQVRKEWRDARMSCDPHSTSVHPLPD